MMLYFVMKKRLRLQYSTDLAVVRVDPKTKTIMSKTRFGAQSTSVHNFYLQY